MTHTENRHAKLRLARVGPKGISLIETVVIMAVGAILTGIVVSSMAAIFRYDRSLRTHATERDQLQLLTQQIRGDIRQAERCKFDSNKKVLTLERSGEGNIYYLWIDDHVERMTVNEEGETIGRFQFPPSIQVTAHPIDAASGQLIRINFTSHDEAVSNKGRETPDWNLEIVSEVGRNLLSHRHNTQKQDQP
jgi:type II secretory pathway pseudopilin PulG